MMPANKCALIGAGFLTAWCGFWTLFKVDPAEALWVAFVSIFGLIACGGIIYILCVFMGALITGNLWS